MRWLTLASILLNVIFSGIYDRITDVPSIAEVTGYFPTYFTPSSYAFTIWLVIYLAFIVYGIIQVLPSQRNHTIYGKLSIPLIAVNFLQVAWIACYTTLHTGISVIILAAALVVSFVLFFRAHRAVLYDNYNLWLQLPFCLLASWLVVALAGGLSVYFKSENISFYFGEGVITILMILIASAIALLINLRTSSLVFPAVIAWAFFAINDARKEDAPAIAEIALSAAILLPVISLISAVSRKVKPHQEVHHSH